ncbi:4Fe-4S dicluster domain-containing protein [Sporanaerobacter sp. PP17-6a]|jgi:2-oxoglutarate ferredoxin oxidoreductase subunit delta|uniref:4Fe-4S dicluster domain-containing protein n=1 Tax=Sporanaerobacter sp. PP17-6a TaxID=1891289 RepID=UPI0008A015E7|nr:4Fe-4S dicluster domain-containing protein [Sporanaerobacter sp. PP17-6a]MBE6082886.1 4Fe-4S dicluster domain-containing protein [Tissierellaceae bacterium]SCL94088.1 2-oxoglutarate-acceptor oxidoreductase subunit OorD [Sporanaerobacter sp. PP17-6a]
MAKVKGKVTFKENICKGCGLCTTVCPMKIVLLDKEKINSKGYHPATVKEMDKCIGCANCATICPDVVITVERFTE